MRSHLSRFTATVFLLAAISGCQEHSQLNEKEQMPKLQFPTDDRTIIEDVGIKSAYLGMPANELGPEWKSEGSDINPRNPSLKRYSYTNRVKGLNIGVSDGKIICINFCYGPEWKIMPFQGKTSSGIGSDSTVEEIIHTYGQPDSMNVIPWKGKEEVSLSYLIRGLFITLTDGQVRSISICEPEPDYDRDLYEDLGDVSKYRSIKPKHPRKDMPPRNI